MHRLTIDGCLLLDRSQIIAGRLTIEAGRIVSVEDQPTAGSGPANQRVDPDQIVAPGFIDLHVHGAGGFTATEGETALRAMAAALSARGVTAFVPTAVSAPLDDLAQFAAVAARVAAEDERLSGRRTVPSRARVLGVHLEGPAIADGHRGAHDAAFLVEPARLLWAWQQEPARWAGVRLVTLAPELPGAVDLIRYLGSLGVVVSLGHSGATFDEAMAGYTAGARSTTHLLNAMSGLEHRAPGLAAAALVQRTAFAELIADEVHVDRRLWPLLWRALGPRLVLVSDAMAAAGLGDGVYNLGRRLVIVTGGQATLKDGTLAGSTITVADGVRNLVAAGLPLHRAVWTATGAPARLLGRRDLGRIAPGAMADLVVLDRHGRVERTMIGGQWLDA